MIMISMRRREYVPNVPNVPIAAPEIQRIEAAKGGPQARRAGGEQCCRHCRRVGMGSCRN